MQVRPKEALKLCEKVFSDSYLAEPAVYVRAAERYGKIMDHLGRSADARDSLFAGQQAAQAFCLPTYEAKMLERIARGYYSGGDYRRAIQYWNSCVEMSNKAGDDAETWILAKVGLAQVYKGAGDYAAALTLMAEAQSRTAEAGDPHLDAKVKINLAVCLIELQRREEAAAVLREAFAICAKHELFDYLAESNFYLGKIALADGALDAAMDYLDAGLTAARQVNFHWCEGHILAVKAEVFARRGELAMALQSVKEAQAIAKADGFFDMLIQQHFAAAEYAAALNDHATAFLEYKSGHEIERRLRAQSLLGRQFDPNEQAGSQQSLNRLLLELSDHDVIDHGELEPALQLITQSSCQVLAVPRVSLWLLDPQTGALVCRCVHSTDGSTTVTDAPLQTAEHPALFERLANPHPVVAHDALRHPQTAELIPTYLGVHDIKSLLIFPIRVAGQTAGALCFENVGAQRNWTQDDLSHGKQLTEIAARVVTSYELKISRKKARGPT